MKYLIAAQDWAIYFLYPKHETLMHEYKELGGRYDALDNRLKGVFKSKQSDDESLSDANVWAGDNSNE